MIKQESSGEEPDIMQAEESALDFSEMMKRKLGVSVYGDPDYVKHVLRYYKKIKDKTETGHNKE